MRSKFVNSMAAKFRFRSRSRLKFTEPLFYSLIQINIVYCFIYSAVPGVKRWKTIKSIYPFNRFISIRLTNPVYIIHKSMLALYISLRKVWITIKLNSEEKKNTSKKAVYCLVDTGKDTVVNNTMCVSISFEYKWNSILYFA